MPFYIDENRKRQEQDRAEGESARKDFVDRTGSFWSGLTSGIGDVAKSIVVDPIVTLAKQSQIGVANNAGVTPEAVANQAKFLDEQVKSGNISKEEADKRKNANKQKADENIKSVKAAEQATGVKQDQSAGATALLDTVGNVGLVKPLATAIGKGASKLAGNVAEDVATKAVTEATTRPPTGVINAEKTTSNAPELSPTTNTSQTIEAPLSLDDLNASATRPVGTSPADFLRQERDKTMAAEVTRGQEQNLGVELNLSPEELGQLTSELKKESKANQLKRLRGLGMTDKQIANYRMAGAQEAEVVDTPLVDIASQLSGLPAKQATEKLKSMGIDSSKLNDIVANAPVGQTKVLTDDATEIKSALPESSGLQGLDLKELDKNLEPFINTGVETAGKKVDRATGRYLQDFIGRSTKQLGKLGADVSKSMVQGSRVKTDIVNNLRPTLQEVEKGVKSIAGKTQTSQDALMKKIGDALENRAEAQNTLSPEEFQVYQKVEKVYDFIKEERRNRGLPTLENYNPHIAIKNGSEAPTYLEGALTSRLSTADSRFSKERIADAMENQKTITVKDLYNYVNSQATEFGYKDAKDVWRNGLKNVPESVQLSPQFAEGVNNLNNAYSKAVNPGHASALDRGLQWVQGNAYQAFLWNNPKNSLFNLAQNIIAKGDVSGEAKTLARSLDKDLAEEIDKSRWFGDSTVSADMAGEMQQSKLAESLRKFDIGRASEEKAVKTPFKLGFAQGISETQAYKDAVAKGLSNSDAVREALKDPTAKQYAIDSGNILVNNTSFGANTTARPEFLRDATGVKRAFTMFMRFPVGMTNFAKEAMNPKEARALDILMKGDPRAVPISEQRAKYQTVLGSLKDIEKAAKQGKFTDVPLDKIQNNIDNMKDNIKVIDDKIKDLSTIRGGKRAAALAKMWAATAAIQMMWDGLTTGEADAGKAINSTNPTLATNPLDMNSRFAGLSSPISPVNRFGQPNYRAIVNAVPGAGVINTMSNYVDGEGSGVLSDALKNLIEGSKEK